MRTKSILAAAAIIAAGAASSQAQSNVYSLNVVGYVNVVCSNGYTIINTPLVPANAQISNLLNDGGTGGSGPVVVPANSSVFTFSGGSFVANFSDEFGGGWSNPSQALTNGTGYFFLNQSGSPVTITFVGEVPQGAVNNTLVAGYNLVGSKVPQAGFISNLGLTTTAGDSVFKFKNGNFVAYFNDEFGGGWSSTAVDFDVNLGPNLAVGEGMFYFRSDINGSATWDRNFTVQ